MGGFVSPQLEQRLRHRAFKSASGGGAILGMKPKLAEIVPIAMLLLLYGIALADGYAMVGLANVIGPAFFAMIVGWAAFRMTQENIHAIWTPLFWYRVAATTFLGIGTALTSFYNNATQDLITSFYAFSPLDLLKFNVVNTLFHFVILSVSYIICEISSPRDQSKRSILRSIEPCNIPLKPIGFAFLLLGVLTNYLILYPVALGIISWRIPNAVSQVGQAAYVGYFLITYWGLVNGERRWVALMIVLAGIDSIIGIFQLTKYAVIFPALMVPIGFIYHKPSTRRILLSLLFIVPYYYYTSNIVYEAREVVERRGAGNSALFADTMAAMKEIAQRREPDTDSPDYQLSWARLNYVNAGTLAINLHDRNLPGDTLRDVFIVWIPRFIYPDKPNITDIARDFTYLANGNYDSSTSPSMPSEGYWDYGWFGVVMFSVIFGTVLTIWSFYSTLVFERRAWHLLLVALLGMRVGVRIDGMLVPDVIGPLSAVLAIHIACQLANRFLPRLPILQRGLA